MKRRCRGTGWRPAESPACFRRSDVIRSGKS
jgi:hypothetical protein